MNDGTQEVIDAGNCGAANGAGVVAAAAAGWLGQRHGVRGRFERQRARAAAVLQSGAAGGGRGRKPRAARQRTLRYARPKISCRVTRVASSYRSQLCVRSLLAGPASDYFGL